MSAHREFAKLLKDSDFFHDIINTNRQATAEIIVALIAELIRQGQMTPVAVQQMLSRMNDATSGISVDTTRRLLVARIRDAIKGIK